MTLSLTVAIPFAPVFITVIIYIFVAFFPLSTLLVSRFVFITLKKKYRLLFLFFFPLPSNVSTFNDKKKIIEKKIKRKKNDAQFKLKKIQIFNLLLHTIEMSCI